MTLTLGPCCKAACFAYCLVRISITRPSTDGSGTESPQPQEGWCDELGICLLLKCLLRLMGPKPNESLSLPPQPNARHLICLAPVPPLLLVWVPLFLTVAVVLVISLPLLSFTSFNPLLESVSGLPLLKTITDMRYGPSTDILFKRKRIKTSH